MSGWVKLHRQMLEWEWYDDINVCRLFTHLLLKANHKDRKWKGVEVKAGSMITGRHVLSEETGLSTKQIRLALDKLKRTGEVAIKTTNKFSVITITSWDMYQQEGQQEGQQRANKGPTKGHKQECNNVKKRKYERDDVPYQEIVDSYNKSMHQVHSTPFAKDVTDKRIKAINGRWDWMTKNAKKKKGVEFFVAYFDYASQSDFLCGKTKDWKANLDWLLKEDNFMKVIEGNYHHD